MILKVPYTFPVFFFPTWKKWSLPWKFSSFRTWRFRPFRENILKTARETKYSVRKNFTQISYVKMVRSMREKKQKNIGLKWLCPWSKNQTRNYLYTIHILRSVWNLKRSSPPIRFPPVPVQKLLVKWNRPDFPPFFNLMCTSNWYKLWKQIETILSKNNSEIGKFKYNITKHFIQVRLFAPTSPPEWRDFF